jgi:K+-transporting ATPase KdpF subunit
VIALFNDITTVIAAVLAVAAIGFLLFALLKPESF